jgi:hypothetical protein
VRPIRLTTLASLTLVAGCLNPQPEDLPSAAAIGPAPGSAQDIADRNGAQAESNGGEFATADDLGASPPADGSDPGEGGSVEADLAQPRPPGTEAPPPAVPRDAGAAEALDGGAADAGD